MAGTQETQTVGSAMVRHPKVLAAGSRVRQVVDFFTDDHVHAALVVDRGRLLTVITRSDLDGRSPDESADDLGTLHGRTIGCSADLNDTHGWMLASGLRRLAVVDADLMLQGLLCLKRSGTGFCSDDGVAARRAERALHC